MYIGSSGELPAQCKSASPGETKKLQIFEIVSESKTSYRMSVAPWECFKCFEYALKVLKILYAYITTDTLPDFPDLPEFPLPDLPDFPLPDLPDFPDLPDLPDFPLPDLPDLLDLPDFPLPDLPDFPLPDFPLPDLTVLISLIIFVSYLPYCFDQQLIVILQSWLVNGMAGAIGPNVSALPLVGRGSE